MKLDCVFLIISLAVASKGATCLAVDHPDYRPFDGGGLDETSFYEPFDYDDLAESPWKVSHAVKNKEFAYVGEWKVDGATVFPGFTGDKGLVMKTPAAHHAISYKLARPIDNRGKDLVFQYEVKLQNGIKCGGTYVKLLSENGDEESSLDQFNNNTSYELMFGPDVCGEDNGVQLILRKYNPKTGEYEEKRLTNPPLSRTGQLSTLYTVILRPDLRFEIRINGDVAKAGNLVEEPSLLEPSLIPPAEIDDVNDVMPENWDAAEFIPDPEAEKPDDYDEKYGNEYIVETGSEMPEEWFENEPFYIPDPTTHQPPEWNEEEDGAWEAPLIENPNCVDGRCGVWNPPLVENPDYKGPWQPPLIPNPNYSGQWKPRKVPNPAFYEDAEPASLRPIGAIGYELWNLNGGVLFDNIYLGHSVDEAEKIGNETFVPKLEIEEAELEANRPVLPNEPVKPPPSFNDLIEDDEDVSLKALIEFVHLVFIRQYYDAIDTYFDFLEDPLTTIMKDPLKFIVYCCVFVSLFTFAFGILSVLVFLITGATSLLGPTSAKPSKHAKGTTHEKTQKDSTKEPKIVELSVEPEAKTTSTEISETNLTNRKS